MPYQDTKDATDQAPVNNSQRQTPKYPSATSPRIPTRSYLTSQIIPPLFFSCVILAVCWHFTERYNRSSGNMRCHLLPRTRIGRNRSKT
ncbi:hypothetical protein ASPTUDRAFT_789705 [Aspergillus tubingensis CBS 134.48]|uniref:Uncharacterized protein n=1 Tax=Aspergillus tubingensis (strain CBS 134.48) TaxID=767770 RepID=A0A1L9MV14_ASPTC|nr:hypothetical protein ASPTUDRAFT_789705 [Aspergillus tubingensis CBS 134.48]